MSTAARAAACAGCDAPLARAVEVCQTCGTPVAPAARRVVTLLFADLAGYTRLCETRDPEQVHLLVRPLMNALRGACQQRGGVVPSIQGDGFLAVFGARGTGEDDAVRALDAAVELQRLVRSRRSVLTELPELRVGLHTGEVLVAASWEEAGLSVSGDAVNVASRVCAQAEPAEVLVTADAAALAGVDAGWGGLRSLQLRGRQAPVEVRRFAWDEVTEVVRGPRWSASLDYVSRAGPEQALRQHLEDGRSVVVRGDAGLGKTRLVQHVLRGTPFLHAAAATVLRPTAAGLCAELLQDVPVASPALLHSLRHGAVEGLTDEAMALRAAGAALAVAGVLVVDDAELLPPAELALLGTAIAASSATWVLASRTPLGLPGIAEVVVGPWSRDEAGALLELALPGASNDLRDAVLDRAGDSPLFVEQCVRLLLDSGSVEVDGRGTRVLDRARLRDVPQSLRLFVASRLDLLGSEERDVLGIAAVLGAELDLALLRHLAGPWEGAVDALVEHGYLRWSAGVGSPVLRFSHALVRDVAYESTLISRRVEIHRAAAEWYAVLPVAQVLESQAYHLEQAVHLQPPDCELLARAVESMVLHARSVEEERTRVARDVLARARALVEGHPQCDVDRLGLELGTAAAEQVAGGNDTARQAALAALALADARSDGAAAAEAHLQLARSHRYLDDAAATGHLAEAAARYDELGDRAGVARVEVERGLLLDHTSGTAAYLEHLELAYQEAMRSADVRLQASCAQWLAMHHAFTRGRAAFEVWGARAREVSRTDDVALEPRLDLADAALAMYGLEGSRGVEPASRALTAGRDLGLAHVYYNALVTALDCDLLSGDLGSAEALLPEARTAARSRPSPWLGLQLDLLEARLRQRQGDVVTASALLDQVSAHQMAGLAVLRRDLAEARAWVALERGRFGEARAHAVEALGVDDETGERCAPLRSRLVELVATVAQRETVPLGTIAVLRAQARETGLTSISQLANRWLYVDDLTRGWTVDLHGLEPLDVVEARALDLEVQALAQRRWELLPQAATTWAELGTTVWQARSLLWHAELIGGDDAEALDLLHRLHAPPELAGQFRAQVRGLR